MTGRVINLRTRRKQKARADKRREADAKAREHGRGRAERALTEAQNRIEVTRLDGHKLESTDDDG